jgi:hypothetical protein
MAAPAEHPDFAHVAEVPPPSVYQRPESHWRYKCAVDLDLLRQKHFFLPTYDGRTQATFRSPHGQGGVRAVVARDGVVTLAIFPQGPAVGEVLAQLAPMLADCAVPPTA